MRNYFKHTIIGYSIILLLVIGSNSEAQKIHKFEQLTVANGLSQNYVQSILCDKKGFLWFGTWDGLYRYDGKRFKTFKAEPNRKNTLTNNRIVNLWQDKQNTLWAKTHDGYIHYFVEATQEFITYPYYLKSLEEKKSTISCITETDHKETLLGSTKSGMYYLVYDESKKRYVDRQFVKETNHSTGSLSDNSISFITVDKQGEFWIGTNRGVNHITRKELNQHEPIFSNYWLTYNFTLGYSLDSIVLFGTEKHGIKICETTTRKFDEHPDLFKDLSTKTITLINRPYQNKLVIGTKSSGLFVFDLEKKNLMTHLLDGKEIKKIYRDLFKTVWINTQEFGIYSTDSTFTNLKHYTLVPPELLSVVDDERQIIFEDSNKNFWIALHANGLAHFDRDRKEFDFYRHAPNDNTTISANNVYCITEDQSGLLWVGTGGPRGGANKIYTTSDAFQRIGLEEKSISGNENVVRSILVDKNGYTWVGTKAGTIHILDKNYNVIKKYNKIPLLGGMHPGQNAYSIMQDKDGYVWIGTKGSGIFVTEHSLEKTNYDYQNLRFINYTHNAQDSLSLSSNVVFSIFQDSQERIWVGTYGEGVNLVTSRNGRTVTCTRLNTANSDLSSNKVRCITEDNGKRLWIATAFGLNYLDLRTLGTIDHHVPSLHPQLHDPRRANGLSYNDVIHVFTDSNSRTWLGTSSGGVNKVNVVGDASISFTHLAMKDGLINDVVYAVLEDKTGHIWFGTDNGISRYNPTDGTFDNFDHDYNFITSALNENACSKAYDGNLLFGTNDGLLLIKPGLIKKDNYMPNVVLTNFQLFNKDVNISDPNSPVKQDIETLEEIILNYNQSSFSIEYAALSYIAPTKNKYAFKLENFDETWNEVGNQNKATYTNLQPGNYLFKVKAAHWNGGWSDKTKVISITILPPWWKTTAMYFVYAIVLIALVEVVRRSYVRYHKLQNDLMVEKRVNDIKLQFFTNISHEIRTPLTLILSPIQDIIEEKKVSENILNKLRLVEKNAKRMLSLVSQLLDFRKAQQNKMTLKVSKIDLISFIKSIVENFNLVAEHKSIRINFNPGSASLDAWVDLNKFDSVIFNILSNAIKFSPRNSDVNIALNPNTQGRIEITISDEGPGIPHEKIDLIFQQFSPLSVENEEFGSSGIGLALSYEIMKLHHGDIIVKSEINKGSEVIIRLLAGSNHFTTEETVHEKTEPLHSHRSDVVDDETITNDLLETPGSTRRKKENHVLIVEDNIEILNYLTESLKRTYAVSTAFNGKEALASIEANQPDIIITDITMPGMNGIEFTRHLKDSITTSHIPVIMLTAKSSIEDQVEGVASGAEAYILKPFNPTYVIAVISNLLKQRSIVYRKYVQNKDNGNLNLKITNKDEKFLMDITQLILDNYSDPEFNVEKLAEKSFMSRTVFYNKMKSLTGVTPIDFLRQKRLHIAAQMIVETDYNISEIAVVTGFNDIKNFSKRFKEIYKITPTQYKQDALKRKNSS